MVHGRQASVVAMEEAKAAEWEAATCVLSAELRNRVRLIFIGARRCAAPLPISRTALPHYPSHALHCPTTRLTHCAAAIDQQYGNSNGTVEIHELRRFDCRDEIFDRMDEGNWGQITSEAFEVAARCTLSLREGSLCGVGVLWLDADGAWREGSGWLLESFRKETCLILRKRNY